MANSTASQSTNSETRNKYSHLRNTLLGDESRSEITENSPLIRSIRNSRDDGTYQSLPSPRMPDATVVPISDSENIRPTVFAERSLEVLLKSGLAYVLCCCIGITLIALKFEGILGSQLNWWLVFTPIWVGNAMLVIGHIMSFKSTLRLKSFADMDFHSNEPHLPLLRRIGTIYAISIPLSILLLWSQLAFCSRLQYKSATNLYVCYAPIIMIEVGFVLRYLLCKAEGNIPGVSWLLSLIFTILLAYKTNVEYHSHHQDVSSYHFIPWWCVLTPLFAFDILMLWCLFALMYYQITGIYRLAPWQNTCCGLYTIALLLTSGGQLLLWNEIENSYEKFTVPSIMIFAGMVFGSIALYIVSLRYVAALMSSRGGSVPVPLTKTSSGWVASGSVMEHWLLLGDIYLGARGLEEKRRRLRQRTHSEVETDRNNFCCFWCFRTKSTRYSADAAAEQRLQHTIRRTTSGSYHDIDSHHETDEG